MLYYVKYTFVLEGSNFILDLYLDEKEQLIKILHRKSTKKIIITDQEFKHYPNPKNLQIVQELDQYFLGKLSEFKSPYVFLEGTDFQKAVWQTISKIKINKPLSYSQIAKSISKPSALRAIGTATGNNPLAIIVPCHRVLPNNLVDQWNTIDRSTFKSLFDTSTSINKNIDPYIKWVGKYAGYSELKYKLLMHEKGMVPFN